MDGKAPKFTKNVAQAPLSSPIRALRDLRKQARPVNTIDQQVQLYQKLFEHLEPRYLSLIANFEMFSPVLKQPRLVKRLKKEGKICGTYVVAETLCNACILDSYGMLKDGSASNPSLITLIRPFLRRNRMKNAAFLDRLATLHTGWKLYWPDRDRMPPSGKIQEIWTAPEQKRPELRRKEFFRLADVLAQDWAHLEKASEKFAALRVKWIAHHELEYDEQTRTYFQAKIPTLTQLYPTLEDVIVTITRCVLHLAIVFKGTDIGLRSFRDVAKRDAANFWSLKTSPNVGVRLKAGQLASN